MSLPSNDLFISRLHWPVTTLGFGRRIGIWLQGCTIRCKGCCSRDTWHSTADHRSSVSEVIEWITSQPLEQVDGFTLSGGEPFDQQEGLLSLAKALRNLPHRSDGVPRDILVYSGYPWLRINEMPPEAIRHLDVVISEPFIEGRGEGYLAGSDNQKVHKLTGLGWFRYASKKEAIESQRHLQMHVTEQGLWLIGIPRRGDLERVRSKVADSGISMNACSWMA